MNTKENLQNPFYQHYSFVVLEKLVTLMLYPLIHLKIQVASPIDMSFEKMSPLHTSVLSTSCRKFNKTVVTSFGCNYEALLVGAQPDHILGPQVSKGKKKISEKVFFPIIHNEEIQKVENNFPVPVPI